MTSLRTAVAAVAVLLFAVPLVAQTSANTPNARDTSAIGASAAVVPVAVSATIDARMPSASAAPAWVNAFSVAPVTAPRTASVRAIESGSTGQNKALMVVGAAGVIGGAIVGGKAGTVLMIGGTAVGLVGLWNYLK